MDNFIKNLRSCGKVPCLRIFFYFFTKQPPNGGGLHLVCGILVHRSTAFMLVLFVFSTFYLIYIMPNYSDLLAAIILAINSNTVLAKDASLESSPENESHEMEGADGMQLRKIEDGSVKSNIHTSKWRVFTDKGRELFLQASILCLCVLAGVLILFV